MTFHIKKKNFFLFLSLSLWILTTSASGTESTCQISDDCPDLYDCVENLCVHKPLFPLTFREVIGTIIILTLNAFLTAGGVGAAAAYLPYIAVLFNVNMQTSVYIGYICVFGGGLGNLINIIRLKNPKTNRFMTNYNINMIVLPALMIGIMIGLIMNRMFPPLVVNIVLMLVLIYSTSKNYLKFKANLAIERKAKAEKAEIQPTEEPIVSAAAAADNIVELKDENQNTQQPIQEEADKNSPNTIAAVSTILDAQIDENLKLNAKQTEAQPDSINCIPEDGKWTAPSTVNSLEGKKTEQQPKTGNSPVYCLNSVATLNVINEDPENAAEAEDPLAEKRALIYKREQRYPFHKLMILLINIVIIVLIAFIRGTSKFDPVVGVEWSCGWDFSGFGMAIFAYGLTLIGSVYLVLKWQREKKEVGYEFLPEEPVLDKFKVTRLIIVSVMAGIAGAIVALGGSMIVGPTLLDMKMPPAFSAATTSLFMIFSMFNTMLQTILNGKLTGQQLAWFLPLSFIFSWASSKIVNWYIKKSGKQSTIILLIMTVAVLGMICLLVLSIKGLVEDISAQTTFKSVC